MLIIHTILSRLPPISLQCPDDFFKFINYTCTHFFSFFQLWYKILMLLFVTIIISEFYMHYPNPLFCSIPLNIITLHCLHKSDAVILLKKKSQFHRICISNHEKTSCNLAAIYFIIKKIKKKSAKFSKQHKD